MAYDKSIEAFNEAYQVIPGGVDSPVRAFAGVGGTPPFIERGEGGYIYDISGSYRGAFILCMLCVGLGCIAFFIAAPRKGFTLSAKT